MRDDKVMCGLLNAERSTIVEEIPDNEIGSPALNDMIVVKSAKCRLSLLCEPRQTKYPRLTAKAVAGGPGKQKRSYIGRHK
jgi:hypothetical protein